MKILQRIRWSFVSTVIGLLGMALSFLVADQISDSPSNYPGVTLLYLIVVGGGMNIVQFTLYTYVHNVIIDWLVSNGKSSGIFVQYCIGLLLAGTIILVMVTYQYLIKKSSIPDFYQIRHKYIYFATFVPIAITANFMLRRAEENSSAWRKT